MKILAIQPQVGRTVTRSEKKQHIESLCNFIKSTMDACKEPSVDLIVLPELATSEYSRNAFEQLSELAEPLDGEIFQRFSAIAAKYASYVSLGFPRRGRDGFYISNMVINRSGKLETFYDKLHMAQFGLSMEKDYFLRGHGLCCFDVAGFRVGVVTCYDFRFADYVRTLIDRHGVNFVLHPVAFARDETFPSWHHFVITRALENQVYFLSLNRAGAQWGASIFCPPWIDQQRRPQVFGEQEEARFFELSREEIEKSRSTFTYATDRLQDYATLEKNVIPGQEEA